MELWTELLFDERCTLSLLPEQPLERLEIFAGF